MNVVLLLSILGTSHLAAVQAEYVCSNNCAVIHPQQHFCNADIAIQAKVLNSDYVNGNHEVVTFAESELIRYYVEVIQPLKGASWATPGFPMSIYTPSAFTCSLPTLAEEEIYLIAGKLDDGLLMVTTCDGIASKWADLTDSQLAGINGEYLQYCKTCPIQSAGTTKWKSTPESLDETESGYWSMEDCFFNPIPSARYGGVDCETLHATCVSEGDECTWTGGEEYRNCFELRESTWFLMEKAEPAYTCRSQCMVLPNQNLRYKCVRQVKKLERQGRERC